MSSNALRTLHEAKQNSQKELLPLANDVKVMSEYLRHEAETHANTLQGSASDCEKRQAWHKLSEICLCLIETIRRCVKMTVEEYSKNKLTNDDGELDGCLTKLEKDLCRYFYRTEIIAK